MAKKRIPEVIRDGSEADFIPENFMLIDGAEGSAKMRMDLFGKASSIEDLDEVKYEMPEDGIPKDDLSEAVQGSLELADSALQASDIEGKAEKSEMSITNVSGDTTKKNIQLKSGLTQNVVIDHQDISGKVGRSEMSVSAVSGDATKKTVTLKSGLSVDVVTEHKAELPTEGKAEGKVLTINDSGEVVWGDAQGGGSDLPPITPSDEGKFLKVDGGSAVWGGGGGGTSYTSGDGISISEGNAISVKTDGSTIHTNASGALEVIGGGGDDPETLTIDISEFFNWFIDGGTDTPTPDVSTIWNTAFDALCDGKQVEAMAIATTGVNAIYRGKLDISTEISSMYGSLKGIIDMLIAQGQSSTIEEAKTFIRTIMEEGNFPSSLFMWPEATVTNYSQRYVDVWRFEILAPFVEDDTQPTHIHPVYEMTYDADFPVIGLRTDKLDGNPENPLENIKLYSADFRSTVYGIITRWEWTDVYGDGRWYEYSRNYCTFSDIREAAQRGLRFALAAPIKMEPCTEGLYNYFKSEYIMNYGEVELQFEGSDYLNLSTPSVVKVNENGFLNKEIMSYRPGDLDDYLGDPKGVMYSSRWRYDSDTNMVLLQSEDIVSFVIAPAPEPEPTPSYEYIILQNFLTGHTIGTPESGTGYSQFYSTYPSDKASIGWDNNKWVDTITNYGVTGSIVDTTPGAQLAFEDPDSTKRFDFSQYGVALGRLPFGYLDISSNNVKGGAYANVSLPQEFTIEAWYLNTDYYTSQVKFMSLYSATLDKKLEVAPSWNNATFAGTQIYSGSPYTPLKNWNHVALTCDGTNLYIFVNGTKVGTVVIADVTGLAEFLASTLELRFNEAYVYNGTTYHNATWYAQIAVCKSCKWTANFKKPYISF